MSKEVLIVRKDRKPTKIIVNGTEILPVQEFAKPKDRIISEEKDHKVMDGEIQPGVESLGTVKTRGKRKPGSTQERQHPITKKEIRTGKMGGDGGGSYDTTEQSITKRADGKVYWEDIKKNPKYYKHEP
jgi:hypothetical protein